jgi:hypothetical protein
MKSLIPRLLHGRRSLVLIVLISLISGVLKAQTLPPIAHTNDDHVLTNHAEHPTKFWLPPRSFTPSVPATVPTNLRDGAFAYDQTQRLYVRWDSVAHAFVRAEADSSFLDPNTFKGSGLSRLDPFSFRDTLLKSNWIINPADTLHPALTVISDKAQAGLLIKPNESIDGRAVVQMRSAKNNQWWEVGANPAGQNKSFGIRRMNGVALPAVDYLWYVEPFTDTSVFPHQVRFTNTRAYTPGDSVAYLKNGFLEIGPAPSGGGTSTNSDSLNHQASAYYLNRANHTGTQAESTIVNLVTDLAGKVPGTRTITINGTTLDLSADRSWTVGSSVTPVSGEAPTGTINGSNATFTAAHTPISGSISVFINGIMERPTTDWTISGATLTMIDIPQTGDNLLINYQY